MSESTSTARVYYLPAPERTAPPVRVTGTRRLWWRLRFVLTGIRLALRPAPTALVEGTLDLGAGRPLQPGRVIDLAAARNRLRSR